MFAVELLYIAFIMLNYAAFIPNLFMSFVMNEYWILLGAFSMSMEMVI